MAWLELHARPIQSIAWWLFLYSCIQRADFISRWEPQNVRQKGHLQVDCSTHHYVWLAHFGLDYTPSVQIHFLLFNIDFNLNSTAWKCVATTEKLPSVLSLLLAESRSSSIQVLAHGSRSLTWATWKPRVYSFKKSYNHEEASVWDQRRLHWLRLGRKDYSLECSISRAI